MPQYNCMPRNLHRVNDVYRAHETEHEEISIEQFNSRQLIYELSYFSAGHGYIKMQLLGNSLSIPKTKRLETSRGEFGYRHYTTHGSFYKLLQSIAMQHGYR